MLKENIQLSEAQVRTRAWALANEDRFRGGVIAAQVGVGKTLMALSLTAHDALSRPTNRDLYIVPPTLQDQWIKEAGKLTHLRTMLYPKYIDDFTFAQMYAAPELHMIVLSYQTLLRAPETSILFKIKWKRIIADEAHCLGNAKSQTTKKVCLLQSDFRWAVSGTPLTNTPKDLFGVSLFLRYVTNIVQFNRGISSGKLIQDLVTQSTQEDLKNLDLKELVSKEFYVDMTMKEKELYDHLRKSIKRSIIIRKSDGAKRMQVGVFELLNRLRTAASNIHLTTDPRNWEAEGVTGGPTVHLSTMKKQGSKTAMVIGLIGAIRQRFPDAKILLFSNFLNIIADYDTHLRAAFPKDGPPLVYTGQIPRQHRTAMVEYFKTSSAMECRVLMLGFKCGNAGINLQCATHVILNEPFWNQSLEQQAIARAYRKGQTEKVYAYRMLTRTTIDERIRKVAERKQERIKAVLSGKAVTAAAATQTLDKISTQEMDYLLGP